MADSRFRVKAHSENQAKTIVKARQFEIVVDEPAELGGTDTGANPVEYVLAAFAGCINVMAHVIAKEMNFELRGVKIDISGDLNPARLFGLSYEDRAGYKQIVVRIKPDCDADAETLNKWKEAIENRCPVSDNLQNPTPVKIEVKA
ncbi:MAG: OsmC family protein [Bacteroidales bacterium]|nr:OsmC family protein [Bacteroidales bacterium]MDD2281301.1 OsmC family protein [Bacteroidales bacterium]MDD4293119.1 OsmC family protein [Bacteroidales bacterium]MDD4492274.1 OsmC family protein [Bacteroidales bacterium]HPS96221.1 OsmC family protein [Bacteroidales bacterium]